MLTIHVLGTEYFDERSQTFTYVDETDLQLEHSLLSVYTWESKWHKPFLSKEPHTSEQTLDYIRSMTLNGPKADSVYTSLTISQQQEIQDYISNAMTATTFSNHQNSPPSREIITSELIYYWMTEHRIPFSCETWHLNRLLTLIRVCNVKKTPPKKMSKREIMQRNRSLNAARRQQMGTSG